MLRGAIKLIAVLLLWVILLPPFFTLACALSPNPAPQDVLLALANVLPFGNLLYDLMNGIIGGLLSGAVPDLLLIGAQSIPSELAFWNEVMQAVLVTVIFCIGSSLARLLLVGLGGNFLEKTAYFLLQTLFTFMAAWLAIVIMDFFSAQVVQLAETAQRIICMLASLIIVGGGVFAMGLLAHVFLIGVGVLLLRGVIINVLKILITYLACFAFLLSLQHMDALIAAPVILLLWLLIMIGLICWDSRLSRHT